MRILHLITRMDGGGSAVNTLASALAQAKAGHAATLAFGPTLESDMGDMERLRVEQGLAGFREAGGKAVILPSLMRAPGLADIRAWRDMRDLISRGFDIVHTHTSKAGALGRLAASGRARVVHTPHGHVFHGYFGVTRTRLFILIERWLAGKTDALIALTKAERDDHLALAIGRPGQWRVIPSGVDVDAIGKRVAAWRDKHAGENQWDAVSVGRLAPVKGMERLLAAWERVCAHRPESRLAIVGDGGEQDRLEGLCRTLGIERNVHFAGWCDPVPYLAASRCFTLLSHNEGMGRAVVEAFAAGLPCVVSDVCGLKELVTDAYGAVVDADNADAVAAALLKDWPGDMRKACRDHAGDYSIEAMVNGLQSLYEELLSDAV